MKLDYDTQKAIYDFLKATSESLCGFKSEATKGFVFNEALAGEVKNSAVLEPNLADLKSKPDIPQFETNEVADGFSGFLSEQELWSLSQVCYDAENCRNCDLCKTRNKNVFGEGAFSFLSESDEKPRPPVMIIGEGPGAGEDMSGRPFVGKAGQLLDKMLAAINLSRKTNCYICNVVKCRPPNNRQPEPNEVSACLPFLKKQIQILRPRFILLMGRTACHALLDTSEGMNRLHGNFFNINSTVFMCTYHPSALLHNESLKRPAWEDLKLFRSRIQDAGFEL